MQPLRFHPIFKQYVWGGRKLGSILSKPIDAGGVFAESWEIVDHGKDQSVVVWGDWLGTTLHQLVTEQGESLLGRHDPQSHFPLLFKFLDARLPLSVQVHPNDSQAALLDPPDLGKTEAWVVLAADSESVIYAGLKHGVDQDAVAREIATGNLELCLHEIRPQVGDCFFLPAGTVHALGAGLLIAEIQQASDTTYRMFDWNRVDERGRSRELHVEAALAVTDYQRGPVYPQRPQPTDQMGCEQLVACDKFLLNRWTIQEPMDLTRDNEMQILAVLEGAVLVEGDPAGKSLCRGETMLVPASCGNVLVKPLATSVVLQMYLP